MLTVFSCRLPVEKTVNRQLLIMIGYEAILAEASELWKWLTATDIASTV